MSELASHSNNSGWFTFIAFCLLLIYAILERTVLRRPMFSYQIRAVITSTITATFFGLILLDDYIQGDPPHIWQILFFTFVWIVVTVGMAIIYRETYRKNR